MLSEYQIDHYRPALLPQVVSLLQHLWGSDQDTNLDYFRWKYIDNPCAENPLGIAALHAGKVIGFRGYLATRWHIREQSDPFIILCPGDTCVHPDHRRKGLSVAMGKLARESYASRCKIFLNLSSSQSSVPGYLKMGFFPLVDKVYLSRHSLIGLIKFVAPAGKTPRGGGGRIRSGEFNGISVTDRPNPEFMSGIISRQNSDGRKIALLQDELFFRWRFDNRRNRYMFYYCAVDKDPAGYVAVRLSQNRRRGFIVDFAECRGTAFEKIIRHICREKHFDVLSVYDFSSVDRFRNALENLGFKKRSMIRALEKKLHGEWPLLVRPVAGHAVEGDYFIAGTDIRKIENWEIKGICSDSD